MLPRIFASFPQPSDFTVLCEPHSLTIDRAGYGWSEPGPLPRTFQAVASDLHNLLREARVDPPFVLVGPRDAASHIRVYYHSYPDEVAGAVFVNGTDVDDPNVKIPDSGKGGFVRTFGSWAVPVRRMACWVRPSLNRLGFTRFANLFGKPRNTDSLDLTAEQQARLNDLSDNATATQAGEACAREEGMQQVRTAGNLKDVPLVVLVSGSGQMMTASHDQVEAAFKKYRLEQVPRALSNLSTRGRVGLIDSELTKEAVVRAVLDILGVAATAQGGTK